MKYQTTASSFDILIKFANILALLVVIGLCIGCLCFRYFPPEYQMKYQTTPTATLSLSPEFIAGILLLLLFATVFFIAFVLGFWIGKAQGLQGKER